MAVLTKAIWLAREMISNEPANLRPARAVLELILVKHASRAGIENELRRVVPVVALAAFIERNVSGIFHFSRGILFSNVTGV